MISDTAWDASTMVANDASVVFTASGRCTSRTVTAVTSPNVPSAPTAVPTRS